MAGTVLYAGLIPMEAQRHERFLGLLQTTGVAAVTAGKVMQPDLRRGEVEGLRRRHLRTEP